LVLFVILLVAIYIGFQISYEQTIYPGVAVGWVDLSGRTPQEAANLLATQFDYPIRGRLLFRDGGKMWVAAPAETGLYIGPEHNAMMAYNYGRSGPVWERLVNQYNAWHSGVNLTPQFVFEERQAKAYLQGIASQIDRPTIEASLSVDGVNVKARPGQVGRSLDIEATLLGLTAQVQTLQDGEVPLVIHENPPMIMDVSEQAEIARRMISEPLTLTAAKGEGGPWVFKRKELAKMLTIERTVTGEGESIQVNLDTDILRAFLEELAPDFEREPANPRFIFNDDTRQLEVLQPAVIGQWLDVEATLQKIRTGLAEDKHTIRLDMEYTDPAVTDDATAESLGITELVSEHTSYFYGSSSARIQNIQTASARFHGVLVPPGATFSMAEALGDVSLDTGYAEAWIIYGDRTIKGVGGGVCQVSTTFFRTVFFGGYPVEERYPHAYRVYYYELTAGGSVNTKLAGLDATVYVPLVDFKFTNDTPNWLLMETYVNPGARTLTWKFYSTSDGRSVEWDTTGLQNKEDPPDPLYQENPELSKGEIKQVDWAIEGADVSVSRTVWRDGNVLHDDVFNTHYMPWRAVCEYGPGTKGMPPKKPNPDNPCQPVKKGD
jgi:vancomycin resistance protein YoaR